MTEQQAVVVDVLVTVYNGDRYIAQTLDSVIAQTLQNWRLIVVDDQSTDRTAEILHEYAVREPRLLIVKGKHKGIAAAANIGLHHVTAPFVARLDADDIAMPQRLQVQVDYLQRHPDVLAVGSDVMLIDERNQPLRRRKAPVGWESIREILKTRNCMCHPSAMIRTSVLRDIGGYREKFKNSLDYDLWLRVAEVGKIENISQDLLLYRRHAFQISASGNSHRQTIYSVGAVTDFFLRKYKIDTIQTAIDESNNDDLVDKLLAVYAVNLTLDDLYAVNRHAIRLLRYARALSDRARHLLRTELLKRLTGWQRWKFLLYTLMGKLGMR